MNKRIRGKTTKNEIENLFHIVAMNILYCSMLRGYKLSEKRQKKNMMEVVVFEHSVNVITYSHLNHFHQNPNEY